MARLAKRSLLRCPRCDHESDLVYQELTGLAEIIHFACPVEKVEGNPGCLLEQKRRYIVFEPG
jgi:hypothetical protein